MDRERDRDMGLTLGIWILRTTGRVTFTTHTDTYTHKAIVSMNSTKLDGEWRVARGQQREK